VRPREGRRGRTTRTRCRGEPLRAAATKNCILASKLKLKIPEVAVLLYKIANDIKPPG
jgi:hypothetical protein